MKAPRIIGVLALTLFSAVGLMLAPGCNADSVGLDGRTVGGACFDHRDCDFRCERGGDFPGGTCTLGCRFHEDCPGGTWCVDVSGGICLLECRDRFDCRGGYDCDSQSARDGRGSFPVCIDD